MLAIVVTMVKHICWRVTLTNNINNEPPRNYVISIVDVLEEINKTWDSRNLDDELFYVLNLDNAMRDMETSRSRYIIVEEDGIDQVGDEEENYVIIQVGDTIDTYLLNQQRWKMIGLTLLIKRTRVILISVKWKLWYTDDLLILDYLW